MPPPPDAVDMDEAAVVTCFLRHRGAVLLFERAAGVDTYPGRWGTVTGYVEDDDPRGTADTEIREVTGRTAVTFVRAGEPFHVVDASLDREWVVHPLLFDADGRAVRTNEETGAAEWVPPTAILRRETVPELWRSYEAVGPTPETIAGDVEHGSAYLSVRALESLRDEAGRAAVEGRGLGPVVERANALLDVRPSMAALANRVNRAMADAASPSGVEAAAIEGIDRAYAADDEAATTAADLLDGGTAITLSRSGTVAAALRRGAGAAVVAESRPACEGIGVAETLAEAGLDVTLCTDAAVGHVLATRDIDAVLVGADAVLPDGRVVNKTGTRLAALAADREGVPCHAVAACDKIQVDEEPHLESGSPDTVYDGDASVAVVNPTFDVTPVDLVDGVATERGVLGPAAIAAVAEEHRELARWREQVD